MKIPEIIKQNPSGFSVEFFPPKSEGGWQSLNKAVAQINELNPSFYSITETGESNTEASKSLTANTLQRISKLVADDFTLMPHFTSYGLNAQEVDKAIDVYRALGTVNILALRGDNTVGAEEDMKREKRFIHADELTRHLRSDDFALGIAVYPETHPESLTITKDREDTLGKIRAGASFAISQLFFDNNFFYDFLDWLKSEGIDIPIIPGILTDFGKLVKFCHRCGASIPRALMKEIAKWENKPREMTDFTVDFVTSQINDLEEYGVTFFHLYSLNKADNILRINEKLNG